MEFMLWFVIAGATFQTQWVEKQDFSNSSVFTTEHQHTRDNAKSEEDSKEDKKQGNYTVPAYD